MKYSYTWAQAVLIACTYVRTYVALHQSCNLISLIVSVDELYSSNSLHFLLFRTDTS